VPYLKGIDLSDKSHNFLSEELLQPNSCKTDTARTNMFASHIIQTVVPNEGETPLVFTNFENQIGKYSASYKSFPRKAKLIAVIKRNDLNSTYIFKVGRKIHSVERKTHERTTESYGYKLHNEVMDKLKVGDIVDPERVLVRSSSHDENMNLTYGVNLNTVFSSMYNATYEDGIIVSESAAKKMNYESVDEIIISVNNNDILVNIYGNNTDYKCFPDIGDYTKDGVLCARRRINYDSAFVELSNRSLKSINYSNDTIFYSKGKVVDIVVHSNIPLEQLESYTYNKQLVKYYKEDLEYRKQIVEVLTPYVEDKECGVDFTPEVSYLYNRSKTILNDESKWTYDKSEFNGIVVKFIMAETKHVVIGSKITNRLLNLAAFRSNPNRIISLIAGKPYMGNQQRSHQYIGGTFND
jgi:hypothetical protein